MNLIYVMGHAVNRDPGLLFPRQPGQNFKQIVMDYAHKEPMSQALIVPAFHV